MVQYKLKDADKFAEYELDPHLAEEKTIYLMEQPVILNNSVIIMLLIKYENAISALYGPPVKGNRAAEGGDTNRKILESEGADRRLTIVIYDGTMTLRLLIWRTGQC